MSSSSGTISKWIGSASAVVIATVAVGAGVIVGVTGSGGGGSPTPPSGVTLVQPDGGTNYYSAWSGAWATTWNDPTFLPIATFGQFNLGSTQPDGFTTIAGNNDAGINTYDALANTLNGDSGDGTHTDGQLIAADNDWSIDLAVQNNVTGSGLTTTVKNHVAGWLYGDEMDGHGCTDSDLATYSWLGGGTCTNNSRGFIPPSFLNSRSNNLRADDTARMVMMGYNHPWAWHLWDESQCSAAPACATLADAGDVLSYDVYVLVESRDPDFGLTPSTDARTPWAEYDSIMIARQGTGTTGSDSHVTKPVFPDLEVSQTDVDSGLNTGPVITPTAAQIKALVWNAIIGGARGYVWFSTCICDTIGKLSFDVINDTTNWPTVHAAVKSVDSNVLGLASVINSSFANGYASVTSGNANVMVKWVPSEGTNGTFYVFAATKQSASQTVTFSLNGAGTQTATGVGPDSGNTFSVSGGSVSMTFADANAVHVFKVANP